MDDSNENYIPRWKRDTVRFRESNDPRYFWIWLFGKITIYKAKKFKNVYPKNSHLHIFIRGRGGGGGGGGEGRVVASVLVRCSME